MMKIPGLDDLLNDLEKRGDTMQATLDRIEALLIKIEANTRSSGNNPFQLYGEGPPPFKV